MGTAGHNVVVDQNAITATVTGNQIQKVGFRAMVQKLAISYNLAGSARNNPDGTVSVTLQGDQEAIARVVAAMKAGSKRSSKDNQVAEVPAEVDSDLKTFTVFAWTSTTRNITTPYDLVFPVRSLDSEISPKDAQAVWNAIAENTLNGDDLAKFRRHLGDDSE
jgi:acylphosphatase